MARGVNGIFPLDGSLPGADPGPDLLPRAGRRHPETAESLGGDTTRLQQAEQHVLGADVVVVQPAGLFLRQDDGAAGSVSESLEHGPTVAPASGPCQYHANSMVFVAENSAEAARRAAERPTVNWEDRLDDWELELELSGQLAGSDWVTLERAAAETGASRAALRTWYRSGQIPSRLVDGPHGPQRLVPLAMVADRAEASPRLRRTAERRLADQAELEILRHRIDQLELRLAALEQRQPPA